MSKKFRLSPGCGCCCGCLDHDTAILVDRTPSMDDSSDDYVQILFLVLENEFQSANGSCKWLGATFQHSIGNDAAYDDGIEVDEPFTTTLTDATNAIDSSAYGGNSGGGHQGLVALKYLADNWEAEGGRSDPDENPRVIIYISDTPAANGDTIDGLYHPTRAETITALTAAGIKVVWISNRYAGGGPGTEGAWGADLATGTGADVAASTDGEFVDSSITNTQALLTEVLCRVYSG
jgi:hypothetical protein